MATQTYAQLQKQIADLQVQAEKLKTNEVAGVVAQIKEAISAYGITARDLFGTKLPKAAVDKTTPKSKSTKSGKSGSAKYSNGAGGIWGGRGPRPQWLRDALAAGKALQDFAVGAASKADLASAAASASAESASAAEAPMKAATRKAKAKPAKQAAKAAKSGKATRRAKASYKDDAGNSWSGFGRQPKWIKDALAAGKTLADLQA